MDLFCESDWLGFFNAVYENSSTISSILIFAMPMLNLQHDLPALMCVDRETRSQVKAHLQNLREVVLDGTRSGLVIHSPARFRQYMCNQLNPAKIRKLVIRSVDMALSCTQEEDIAEWEFSNNDLRARTFQFPTALLSRMNGLRHFVIESTSRLESVVEGHSFNFRQPQRTAPLQLGLANLHELAGSCPLLETLSSAHFEVNRMGIITDVWGPDCSVLALRQLVRSCPNLQFLGVLSPPGARMLREYRRLFEVDSMESVIQQPEIQECFTKSFLHVIETELPQVGPPLHIAVAMANIFSPTSSARGSLDYYRLLRYGATQAGSRLGDMSDLIELAPSFPERVQLLCFARTVISRINGYTQGLTALEFTQSTLVKCKLTEANVTDREVQLVHLPVGRHPFSHRPTVVDLSRFHTWKTFEASLAYAGEEEENLTEAEPVEEIRAVTTATTMNRSTSFTVNVRTEPAPLHKSPTVRSQDSMAQQLITRFNGDGTDISEFEPFDESGDIQVYMLERSTTQDLV